jgi:hypothetical protein
LSEVRNAITGNAVLQLTESHRATGLDTPDIEAWISKISDFHFGKMTGQNPAAEWRSRSFQYEINILKCLMYRTPTAVIETGLSFRQDVPKFVDGHKATVNPSRPCTWARIFCARFFCEVGREDNMKFRTLVAAAFCAAGSGALAAPVQWEVADGGNDHWYDFVVLDSAITATEAESAAEGASHMGSAGYLATITTAAEQSFLNTPWPGIGSVVGQFNSYSYFLIGASDRDSEGSFEWIGGPEDGDALTYTNWKGGEPNDFGGEDYTVAWWEDSAAGLWNDIPGDEVLAYVVEYDAATMTPPTIPVPASLPLLLAGFAGLAFFRRKTS